MTRTRNIFVLLAATLVGIFLWRVFTPSHEIPSQGLMVFNIVSDALGLIALILCWTDLPSEFRGSAGARALCVVAIVAGIGLFAIRLHNENSLWTGHYNYSVASRRVTQFTDSPP